MTLCVAAVCRGHRRLFNAIVFATDFQVEGEMAKAEIGHKIAITQHEEHPMLMAGTLTRALSLTRYISGLHASTRPDDPKEQHHSADWESIFHEAVKLHKWSLADELVGARFGFGYKFLLENGKNGLSDEAYRDTIADIARLSLDCSILIAAFSQTDPNIYRVEASGVVEQCDNFAAIGSGYYVAEASLFQREQTITNDLGTTIYNVYEAMKLGSSAPGVGQKFEIGVSYWEYFEKVPTNAGSVTMCWLEPQYYSYLQKKFERYGPKRVSKINVRPRWIKEPRQVFVVTPKGMHNPELKKKMEQARKRGKRLEELKKLTPDVKPTSSHPLAFQKLKQEQ
jgi:hypothetical protein